MQSVWLLVVHAQSVWWLHPSYYPAGAHTGQTAKRISANQHLTNTG